MTVFCFALASTLEPLGGPAAFSLALATALAVQAMVFALRPQRLRPQATGE